MKVAILGFGVVGSGAYEVLENAGYTYIPTSIDAGICEYFG